MKLDPDNSLSLFTITSIVILLATAAPASRADGPDPAVRRAADRGEPVAPKMTPPRAGGGEKSLSTFIGEAGMAVPLGGDDIVVARSPSLFGPAWLHITGDGAYYAAVAAGGDVLLYRSLDKGETWTLWSTFVDPDAQVLYLRCFVLAEGIADRAYVVYRRYLSVDTAEVCVASIDIGAAVPTWTIVVALSAPGVNFGANFNFDLATDAIHYDDYYLYLITEYADAAGNGIWFTRSLDLGATWEPGYALATAPSGPYERRSAPHIAYGNGGYVHISYTSINDDSPSYTDTHYRRAPLWAGGGAASWEPEQALLAGTPGAWGVPLQLGASSTDGGVYAAILNLSGAPRMRFSTDHGATWPPANQVTTTNLPDYNGMTPVLLPGGELAIAGVDITNDTGDGITWINIVQSRSTTADPTSWSAKQRFSRYIWNASAHSLVESMLPDPAFGNRLAILWLQTTAGESILRFDAEWRRDPGYANTDVGFPISFTGGGISPPAIAEIDGTAGLEIVFGTYSGDIHVLNHDGTPVPGWPVNIGSMPYDAPVAVGDLTGDGRPYIVAGNRNGQVFAFEPDGTLAPGWPVTMAEATHVYVSIGALGPPFPRYVVAVCGQEMRALKYDGVNVSPAWGTFSDAFSRPAAIGDVDGDGIAEIVTLKGSWLHVHKLQAASALTFRHFPGEFFSDAPTLADIDGDGTLEIAAPTADGRLHLLNHDGTSYSASWPITVPSGSGLTAVSFGQILGTQEPELVFGEQLTGLVHVRYHDGGSQTGFPKSTGSVALYQPPILARVETTARAAIIGTIETGGGNARSWSNLGAVSPGWPRNLPGPVENSFASGDIDGDGRNELVVVGVNFVTVLDLGVSPTTAARNFWPMYGYNAQRTGCLDCPEDVTTSVDPVTPPAPVLALAAHPNPFNPATVITFTVDRAGPVTLAVYDLAGRRVATLVGGDLREAGDHTVSYNAARASSGVYFVRLQTAGGEVTRKIALLK